MRALPRIALALALLAGGAAAAAEGDPAPTTTDAWLESQHVILRRYLNVMRQAQHDFEYGYPTPTLIVPLTVDLYLTYVAHLHQIEHLALYPFVQPRLPAERRQMVEALRKGIRSEFSAMRTLQRRWREHGGDLASPPLAEALETVIRLVNRHIVVQEEQVFPVLYALTPEEHRALLQRLAAVERAFVPPSGRARTVQALDYLEDRIRIDSPRKW